MDKMHSLLNRQLRKVFSESFTIPKEWRGFVEAVNRAYLEFDADRNMLERSLELSSQELLQANSEMRAVFQAFPDIFFRLDKEGTILEYKTGSTTDLYIPLEELIGKKIHNVPFENIGDKFFEAIHEVQKTKSTISIEYSMRLEDQEYYYEARMLPLLQDQIFVIVRNTTERRQAEKALEKYRDHLEEIVEQRTKELRNAQEELIKREKLSVLGRLTAIVSHDLRNPLGVIRSSTFYLERKLSDADEKIAKHLQRIDEQVGLCDSIVDELLEYTRGRQSNMVEEELNPWLEKVLDQTAIPEQVAMIRELSPGLLMVRFDKEKMRRVVINLVENALQAVIARQERLKKEDDPYQPQMKVSTSITDNGVCVEVEDNGSGMDDETARRAFEPLFTTRARGTGLGLAIVKKIVDEHGGRVELSSEPDRGTKVIVVISGSNQIGD